MTSITHIWGNKYEITIETTDKKSYDAIMKVVYEQKEREKNEQNMGNN